MKIIKRNGAEAEFDSRKIAAAIGKASNAAAMSERLSTADIEEMTERVVATCELLGRAPSVEEVQDMVEKQIMSHGAFEVAKRYITYRYTRALVRHSNTTDDKILSLIECANEEAKQENANKNPVINSTQRDYMAGEVSKDLTERLLLPHDIVEAHNAGIIHFHDADYYAQHMHNCDLVNLEDMLQNGTVITGTLIEKPHSFSTACNIATQIIAQVASNQYGGQSISLAHLAPFVQVSRERIRREIEEEFRDTGIQVEEKALEKIDTIEELVNAIKGCTDPDNIDSIFQGNLTTFLEQMCSCKNYIVDTSEGEDSLGNTLGEMSLAYFKYIVEQETERCVFLIDQPEDHISNNNISKKLLSYFNSIRNKKQIIIVTHNPLLVVNQDVDHVIFVRKTGDKIDVISGCLEQEGENGNILEIVASNMDGGKESIEKRLKVYG